MRGVACVGVARAWGRLRGVACVAAGPDAQPVYLTLRQGQVATLIAAGASNLDVAETLGITEKTVDKHIAAIKERTGLGTRTAIAASFQTVLAQPAAV